MSTYKNIKRFIENFQSNNENLDIEVNRVVVPDTDWEEVKEKANHDPEEVGAKYTVKGVTLTWSSKFSSPEAQIKIPDSSKKNGEGE